MVIPIIVMLAWGSHKKAIVYNRALINKTKGDKVMNTKSTLIFLGALTIALTSIAMFRNTSTDGWWGLVMGISLIVIGYSLDKQAEKS
mgnify:CR=1 FL=1